MYNTLVGFLVIGLTALIVYLGTKYFLNAFLIGIGIFLALGICYIVGTIVLMGADK